MKYRIAFSVCLVVFIGIVVGCGNSAGSTNSTNSTPPPNTTAAHQVRVTLTDSTIESSITTFSAGITYSFVVTNKGQRSHDFIIRTRPKGPVTDPHSGVLYATKALSPGVAQNFTFTFPMSTPQSSVQFTSEYAGTNANGAGIQLPVEVKQG